MSWEVKLKNLVPDYIREGSQRWVDLLDSIGKWLDSADGAQAKIDGLLDLINPETVDMRFIQNLADLIKFESSKFLGDDDYIIRRQVRQAVDWYRIKGTYRAINVILYTVGLNAEVYDLYTSNYTNFVRMPWFCAGISDVMDVGLNFDAGLFLDTGINTDVFFKSPHFDVEIELDKYFGTSPTWELLGEDRFSEAEKRVKEVRPVNTVPHYYAHLLAETDESKEPYTKGGSSISAVVTNEWLDSALFLDMPGLYLDDGLVFDFTRNDFFSLVQKFKIGTGNKGVVPDASMTDLANPVYSGDITLRTIYGDRVVFEIQIPQSEVQGGLSEIGLFNNDYSKMYAIAIHPSVDKLNSYKLNHEFVVWFGSAL